MDHIRAYNHTKYLILETNSSLTPPEQRMFNRIIKHEDTWLKQFTDVLKETDDKKKRFTEHYNIIKFINEEPKKMLSILGKIFSNELFHKWFDEYGKDLPPEFDNVLGTAIDLKKLGF